MTARKWLKGAQVVDLSVSPWRRGNGPFNTFLGVCLHVNVSPQGTSVDFFKNNAGEVTSNFQVYNDGKIVQFLPFNWQPWCQINGNFNYSAIETAGMPNEPLTDAQCAAIASILDVYHSDMGFVPQVANTPGQKGLITHKAGGLAWGGHECPGDIRTAQRPHLLSLMKVNGGPNKEPADPTLIRQWPDWMLPGHSFGDIDGPGHIHGGIDEREQRVITHIQHRFQHLGFAPAGGGWADGVWEKETTIACKKWHAENFPHALHPNLITHTAWTKLFKRIEEKDGKH